MSMARLRLSPKSSTSLVSRSSEAENEWWFGLGGSIRPPLRVGGCFGFILCSWDLGFGVWGLPPIRSLGSHGWGDGLHLALLRLGLGFDSLGDGKLDGRSSDHLGLGGNFLHGSVWFVVGVWFRCGNRTAGVLGGRPKSVKWILGWKRFSK